MGTDHPPEVLAALDLAIRRTRHHRYRELLDADPAVWGPELLRMAAAPWPPEPAPPPAKPRVPLGTRHDGVAPP